MCFQAKSRRKSVFQPSAREKMKKSTKSRPPPILLYEEGCCVSQRVHLSCIKSRCSRFGLPYNEATTMEMDGKEEKWMEIRKQELKGVLVIAKYYQVICHRYIHRHQLPLYSRYSSVYKCLQVHASAKVSLFI